MPTYMPERGSAVAMPPRPLQVHAWDQHTTRPVRLRADLEDGPPDPRAQYPYAGLLLLPGVGRPTRVRVSPAQDGTLFPHGTRIGLRLQTDGVAGTEPVQVVVGGVDASGLGSCDLLLLRPQTDRLVVEVLDAVGDDPLDGLAAVVRAQAWKHLQVEEYGPPPRWALSLLVDGSGSMRAGIDDGSVAALVEAVVGLAAVLGAGGTARTGISGRAVTWLADSPGRHLADTVVTAIRDGGYGVGFRPSATELPAAGPDGRGAVVLITDGSPPDAAALAERCARDGVHGQVLVTGHQAVVGNPPPGIAYTVLAPPPPGRPALEHLRAPESAAVLDAFLTSLLAPWTRSFGPEHPDQEPTP